MSKENMAMMWNGLTFVGLGLLLIFFLSQTLAPDLALWSFWIGVALLAMGIVNFAWMFWRNRSVIIAYHRKRMRHANEGVVWVWAVCLAGICVYAVAFYALVYPTLELIGVVEGLGTWDPQAAVTLNLVKVVLNWHPILFILGLILWAFVNSVRREDVTYPIY